MRFVHQQEIHRSIISDINIDIAIKVYVGGNDTQTFPWWILAKPTRLFNKATGTITQIKSIRQTGETPWGAHLSN